MNGQQHGNGKYTKSQTGKQVEGRWQNGKMTHVVTDKVDEADI